MTRYSRISVSVPREQDVARILERLGADPASSVRTGDAVEAFFNRLHKRFKPLVGENGYRALLQTVHRKVVKNHPVLERCVAETGENLSFAGLGARLDDADPAEAWEGLMTLTVEFLRLANSMARGQDITPPDVEGPDLTSSGLGPEKTLERLEGAMERASQEGPSTSEAGVPAPVGEERERARRSAQPWRILIMDRDRLTCEALARALGRARDLHVVDHAMATAEAEEKVRAEDIDFVVVSAHLPKDEVLEVCRWLRREHTGKSPHVVVTGLPEDDAVILRFLEAGAAAFTMEEFSVEGLRLVLRLLARGESVFPLRLQHLMSLRLSELSELLRDRGLDPDTLSTLTSREGEVLLLLDEGLTNRQIAKKLFISEGTVKSHVHQILKKLKTRDRNEAVRLLRLQRAAPGKLVLTKTGFRREG